MVFLGIVMMPFYYISKTHSVPGYLQLRFGPEASGLSAVTFAFMTILMSRREYVRHGGGDEGGAGLEHPFQHLGFVSLTVGIYVAAGGLFSAIFNEVLQFFLIWFGALLIPILGLIETGGWSGMVARIHQNFPGQDFTHMWATLGIVHRQSHGHPLDRHRVRPGRGAVDGLLDDGLPGGAARAFAPKICASAKLAPIIGAFFKMAVPLDRDSARLAGAGRAARCTWFRRAKLQPPGSTATTKCCR